MDVAFKKKCVCVYICELFKKGTRVSRSVQGHWKENCVHPLCQYNISKYSQNVSVSLFHIQKLVLQDSLAAFMRNLRNELTFLERWVKEVFCNQNKIIQQQLTKLSQKRATKKSCFQLTFCIYKFEISDYRVQWGKRAGDKLIRPLLERLCQREPTRANCPGAAEALSHKDG